MKSDSSTGWPVNQYRLDDHEYRATFPPLSPPLDDQPLSSSYAKINVEVEDDRVQPTTTRTTTVLPVTG